MEIQFDHVKRIFPPETTPALDVPELRLERGRIHGILGHSGSGKSTMLNLLALLDRPEKKGWLRFLPGGPDSIWHWGRPRRHGEKYIQNAARWRKQHYGFVFQSGYLLENFSVWENVLMPMRIKGGLNRSAKTAARGILDRLGFEPHQLHALPMHLSGGQRQRVAVARAIALRPQILFADEPTGSLDPFTGAMVMEELKRWREENPENNTLILVTHNPKHVEDYCDVVTVLEHGRVVYGPAPRERFRGEFDKVVNAMSAAHQLRLMEDVAPEELPESGESLFIVARSQAGLHFRAFDRSGQRTADFSENAITAPGQPKLEELRNLLGDHFPPEHTLSFSQKQAILRQIRNLCLMYPL